MHLPRLWPASAPTSWLSGHTRRVSVWLPTAILVVAALARLANLADVPPGLQHDEVFKTMFAEQVRAGEFPLFFDLNGGNEPFFAYLVTCSLALFGPNVLALRLPAVAGGLIGVAAIWWVARRMWGVRVGALAALLMSASLWHIMDSRVSLRAIWLPATMTLSYGFLWSWWESRRSGRLLLGALLLGLSLYTYTSAALGVATVLAFGLLTAFRAEHRRAASGLVAAAVLATALGVPLVVHMARVPEASVRVRDLNQGLVALRAGDPLPVLTSTAKVAGMFAFTGDPEWRYNVASRPVFTLGIGLAFYVGVWACWRERRQPRCLFLLLWLVLNLGASAVTSSAPSSLRAVGAAPAAYVTAAVGCWWLWAWATERGWRPYASAVMVVAVTVELGSGLYGYFVTWPQHPEVREIYRADLADMARYLRRSGRTEQVMMSAEYAADLDRLSFEYLGFTSVKPRYFDGHTMLVIPAQPTLVLVPHLRPMASALVPVLEERALLAERQSAFEVWEVRSAGEVDSASLVQQGPGSVLLPADVLTPWPGLGLRLLEVRLPDQVDAGETLEVLLQYEVTAPAPGGHNVKLFAHLRDGAGFLWSQADVLTYPTSDWRVGDQVYQVLPLPVPADMPGGSVSVDLGVYEDPARPFELLLGPERIPFTRLAAGISRVKGIGGVDPSQVSPELVLDVGVDGGSLRGASVAPRIVQPGGDLEVSLWWEATGPRPAIASWVLRRDEDTVVLDEQDRGAWEKLSPDKVVRDRRRLRVPADAARGEWELVARLGPDGETAVGLGIVFVAGIERDFSTPMPVVPAEAKFGGGALLLGLAQPVDRIRQGENLTIELLWRSLEPFEHDYTVFVQLVDGNGRVVAAHDGQPGEGARPTRGWLPGETVHDVHTLPIAADLPPGTYSLVAGLYLADAPGYPRLSASGADVLGADAAILTTVEVIE